MTHGSLFSGIGGFDLAAEWSGWENLFNCEWEKFPRKVLEHHFPNAKQYEDIKDFNATDYNGRIDVLSGGFPCQPFSVAGKRKGSEDPRHLWPQMLRIIGECQPRWVLGENVRGLCSWSNGLVFETCCSDLEALGYSVQSFVVPACATGAPHRRDRVWIIAHSDSTSGTIERINRQREGKSIGRSSDTIQDRWEKFPTVPPVCGGDDGLSKELDGITFPKWRRESIKAYGNAIVPQVAYRIFQSINDYENDTD